MSILGKIFDRIRGHAEPAAAASAAPATRVAQAPAAAPAVPPQAQPSVQQPAATPPGSPAAPAPAAVAAIPAAPAIERVDMEKVLDDMASKNPQKLNWRNSIVDLMKLVGMDSTLQERRELADEMGYTGDRSDTAAMNMWLHKKLMERLKA